MFDERPMKKRVVVIGGGIAGLSAGVYAQKCGFDVTILESHNIAGGNCTAWRRGAYLFEGGMHWLTGSSKSDALNKLWRHIGALNDNVTVRYDEPFMGFNHGNTVIKIYRDVDLTEKHLLELSPADAKEIKKFCGFIRRVKNLVMPVTDLRGVRVTKKSSMPLSMLFSVLSAVRTLGALSKLSRDKFINSFTHEGIRDMIRASTSEKNGILAFVFTLATIARGEGGFPEGGSLPFVDRIVKTFTRMGGKILYDTRADRVITENNPVNGRRAIGVITGAKKIYVDAVIITADTMAIDHLFDVPPKARWLDEMKAVTEPTMATFVSLGINADLKKYQKEYSFKLKSPIKIGDEIYEFMSLYNYADDPVYSPEGKTALTIPLGGDTYDFWKKAKEENRYAGEKQRVANAVIEALSIQMPETAGKVEVVDVATPLTYERYCANWKGSWMTEMKPGIKMKTYPAVINGLDGVYFAGHRMTPPGGLPIALVSGRMAVQHLCRDTGTLFVSEED